MPYSLKHLLRQCLLGSVALCGLTSGSIAQSHNNNNVPDRMEPQTDKFRRDTKDVGITEHLGSTVPLALPFTDSTGRDVTLGDYLKQGRPVILQLGYFNCPQLCDKVSESIMEGVKGLPLELGKDYDMLYVSVNPTERWELGQRKKRTYVEEFGKPGAVAGWNFLVGKEPAIKQLADAIGFGYRKIEGRDEYSHPPMIVVLTSDGKISRYFYGFQYPSETLKIGLTEAGQGKVGAYVEQVLVALCYHFDEYSGKYSWSYMKLMQVGAVLTMLVVFGFLGSRWLKDYRASKATPSSPLPHG